MQLLSICAQVKHSIYYEPDYWPFRIRRSYSEADRNAFMLWPGNILEVDVQNVVHLHNYVFNFDMEKQRLSIVWHQRIDIPLLNFFDCQKRGVGERLESRDQLKGLIFLIGPSKTKDQTLLFVDHYYVLFRLDLLPGQFDLRSLGQGGEVSQLEFRSPDKEEVFGVADMKYVKHYRSDRGPDYLFAFSSKRTYELAGRDAWDKPLTLSASPKSKVHVCPYSTATFDGVTACWGRQVIGYHISSNRFLHTF